MHNVLGSCERAKVHGDTDILHYGLQYLLPAGHLLALNLKIHSLSLVTNGPLIVAQQQLTDSEQRVLIPILDSFPNYCPYDVLLTSISSLSGTASSTIYWQQRLEEAQNDGTWQQELRPLRRALSSLRNKLHSFGLEISTVRERGCSLTSLMRTLP